MHDEAIRRDERLRVARFLERKAKETQARVMGAARLSDPAGRALQKQVADKCHDILAVIGKMVADNMLEEQGSHIPGVDIQIRQVL